MKVSSVQAILATNLEVVICTFGFKCPELGCTRVSPRLCLLFTAGVRSVWRSEDVYTMTLQCSISGAASPTLDSAWNTRARHTRLREEVME